MPTDEKNEVRMIGVLPSLGADPIKVRLATEAAGAGMIEKNEVKMVGVLPSEGADPIPVAFEAGAGVCRIKTGTYTGDGTESKAITGVGFQPKYVKVWQHVEAVATYVAYEKLDQGWGTYDYAQYHDGGRDNEIISLDADGFTVDDGGADSHPNADGYVYDYLCLG